MTVWYCSKGACTCGARDAVPEAAAHKATKLGSAVHNTPAMRRGAEAANNVAGPQQSKGTGGSKSSLHTARAYVLCTWGPPLSHET